MYAKNSLTQWWTDFYNESPFQVQLERSDLVSLSATVDFIWDKLKLAPGKKVFDQCCGIGSLSIPLALRGADTIGVDLCERHIQVAAQKAKEVRADCQFQVGDAFTFRAQPACDGALNWWTSFGYAESDEQNLLMLARVYESLKPGGRFLIDYPNMGWVLKQGNKVTTDRHATADGDIELTVNTTINLEQGLREQVWTYRLPDGRSMSYDTSLRIYLPHMLVNLLERSGFETTKMYGNINDEPLSLDSERCICLARRPK